MEFLCRSCRHRVSHSETSKVLEPSPFQQRQSQSLAKGFRCGQLKREVAGFLRPSPAHFASPDQEFRSLPGHPASFRPLERPSSQLHPCMRSAVGAREARVATMAGTLSGMQRQPEAAKQEHAEHLRLQPSDGAGWASHDRPSARAQQHLKNSCKAFLLSCRRRARPILKGMLLSKMFSQNERAPLWIVEPITQTVARFNGSPHVES